MARPHVHSVVLVGWPEEIGRALEPLLAGRSLALRSVRSIGGAIDVLDQHRNCLVIADADAGIDPTDLRQRMRAEGHGGVPTVVVARGADPTPPDPDVVAVLTSVNAEQLVELAWTYCRVSKNGVEDDPPGAER
jgi:hypothetical protein